MDESKELRAKEVYDTLLDTLNERGIRYEYDESKNQVYLHSRGEDFPIDITFTVQPERDLIIAMSRLTFTVPEDKRIGFAIAVGMVNSVLVDGNFELDLEHGELYFKLTSSYYDSQIGSTVFNYILDCCGALIDQYDDKFFAMAKGYVTLDKFLEELP